LALQALGAYKGTTKDVIDKYVVSDERSSALIFWWADHILRAAEQTKTGKSSCRLEAVFEAAKDASNFGISFLRNMMKKLKGKDRNLLVVFDALDTVAYTWPREGC